MRISVFVCVHECLYLHVYAHALALSWKFFYLGFTKTPIFCDTYHRFWNYCTAISSNWQLHDKVTLLGINYFTCLQLCVLRDNSAMILPTPVRTVPSANTRRTQDKHPVPHVQHHIQLLHLHLTAALTATVSSYLLWVWCTCQELGCSSVLEHQTHDRKVLGLIPNRSSRWDSTSVLLQ